jgi:HSP20 family protein
MFDIARFNPLRRVSRFDPFSRDIFKDIDDLYLTPFNLNRMTGGQFPIDVSEDDKSYKVHAEIPGFSKEDIHVTVNGDQISISAETRKEEEEKKGEQVVLKECHYGSQYRAFTLPQAVDDAKCSAKYANGVLDLVLPKKEGTVSNKQINIM